MAGGNSHYTVLRIVVPGFEYSWCCFILAIRSTHHMRGVCALWWKLLFSFFQSAPGMGGCHQRLHFGSSLQHISDICSERRNADIGAPLVFDEKDLRQTYYKLIFTYKNTAHTAAVNFLFMG